MLGRSRALVYGDIAILAILDAGEHRAQGEHIACPFGARFYCRRRLNFRRSRCRHISRLQRVIAGHPIGTSPLMGRIRDAR